MKKIFSDTFEWVFLLGNLFASLFFFLSILMVIPWSLGYLYLGESVETWLIVTALASPVAVALCFSQPKWRVELRQVEILDNYSNFLKARAEKLNTFSSRLYMWRHTANGWYEKYYTAKLRVWYGSANILLTLIGLIGLYEVAEMMVFRAVLIASGLAFLVVITLVITYKLFGSNFDEPPPAEDSQKIITKVKVIVPDLPPSQAEDIGPKKESTLKTAALLLGNGWVTTVLGIFFFSTYFFTRKFGFTMTWGIFIFSITILGLLFSYLNSDLKPEKRWFFMATGASASVGMFSAFVLLLWRYDVITRVWLDFWALGIVIVGALIVLAGVILQTIQDAIKIARRTAAA